MENIIFKLKILYNIIYIIENIIISYRFNVLETRKGKQIFFRNSIRWSLNELFTFGWFDSES